MPEFEYIPNVRERITAHVDADSVMFLIGWQLAKTEFLTSIDTSKLTRPPDTVYNYVHTFVENLITELNCDEITFHFTASDKNKELFKKYYNRDISPQFRTQLERDYKVNRKHLALPHLYAHTLEVLLSTYNSYMHDTHEADDAIVLLKKLNPNDIVASNDKDVYNQIVGEAFQYDKRKSRSQTTKETANMFPYLQTITGDPTDGFGGAKGIGIKAIPKFLNINMSPYEMWQGVVAAFKSVHMTEEDALFNMRMANMHQLSNTGEIQLFEPPAKDAEHVYQ